MRNQLKYSLTLQQSLLRATRSDSGMMVIPNESGIGELNLGIVELLDARATTFLGIESLNLEDLNGVGTSAMTGSHVTIYRERSENQVRIEELLVRSF